jgi:hypothetical protein
MNDEKLRVVSGPTVILKEEILLKRVYFKVIEYIKEPSCYLLSGAVCLWQTKWQREPHFPGTGTLPPAGLFAQNLYRNEYSI